MELEYDDLKNIIEGFAKNGKIFSNEAQFQFELAFAIKNKFENSEIYLEHLVLVSDDTENNTQILKMYIDIIVKIDNDYYPIELKYKTANERIEYQRSNGGKVYTFNQGAPDTGSYDFIKDINRLEQLVYGFNNEELRVVSKGKETKIFNPRLDYTSLIIDENSLQKGFAIMITNNEKYFDKTSYKTSYWENFSLSGDDNNSKELKGNLYWIVDNHEIKENDNYENYKKQLGKIVNSVSLSRSKPIKLQGTYTLNWEDYDVKGYDNQNDDKKHSFKYLIVEVAKHNNA